MITQQLDNASDLSTGEETIYITDKELDALAQELTKEYGDFIGNNIMGIDQLFNYKNILKSLTHITTQ